MADGSVRYKCDAITVEGFVQQLACNLINHGYWFYSTSLVPPGKDPRKVDQKLVTGYDLAVSKWVQARRKAKGIAKLAYLRHERQIILVATQGEHVFFRREQVRDFRREPFVINGYSIGAGKGGDGRHHASVHIDARRFQELRAYLLDLAVHRDASTVGAALSNLPFVPYARIRRQLLRLLREVNERRSAAGFSPVPRTWLRLRRYPVKVFSDDASKVTPIADTVAVEAS